MILVLHLPSLDKGQYLVDHLLVRGEKSWGKEEKLERSLKPLEKLQVKLPHKLKLR